MHIQLLFSDYKFNIESQLKNNKQLRYMSCIDQSWSMLLLHISLSALHNVDKQIENDCKYRAMHYNK